MEVVADEGWVDPWSVAGVPCKHVGIPLEKLDQLFLLLRRQLGPYLKEFLRRPPSDLRILPHRRLSQEVAPGLLIAINHFP